MSIKSRLARPEARQRIARGRRLIVVPTLEGEDRDAALAAAGVVPEADDVVIFRRRFDDAPIDRTPRISRIGIR